MSKGFLEIGGSLVRLDAITRLAAQKVVGNPDTLAYRIHLSDGGFLSVSPSDYVRVKRALTPPAKGTKSKLREAS